MANAKWQMGSVRWFDDERGEGMIRTEDGKSIYVHYSAIESGNKHKSLKKNKKVKFKVLEDSHYTQVEKIKEI